MATGRHTVLLTPHVNPVAYHYSPNRSFASFYVVPVIDEIEAATRDARNLLDIYAQLGVTHLVRAAEDELLFAAAVDASVRAHPETSGSGGRIAIGRPRYLRSARTHDDSPYVVAAGGLRAACLASFARS